MAKLNLNELKRINESIVLGGNKNTITFSCLKNAQWCNNGIWEEYTENGVVGTETLKPTGTKLFVVESVKDKMSQNNKLSHTAQIVIPKKVVKNGNVVDNPFLTSLKNKLNSVWRQAQLPKEFNNPMSDGDEKAKELEDAGKNGSRYIGTVILKITTKHDVKFSNWQRKIIPIKLDSELDGKYCNISMLLKPYWVGGQTGNKGISCYVSQIQLLGQNPDFEFGQSPEDVFEEYTEEIEEPTEPTEPQANNANNETSEDVTGTIGEDEVPF